MISIWLRTIVNENGVTPSAELERFPLTSITQNAFMVINSFYWVTHVLFVKICVLTHQFV